MLKRSAFLLLAALVGLTLQAAAVTTPADLRRLLDSRDWQKGASRCADLAAVEGLRGQPDPPLPGSHFAESAALCAAIESGRGDDLAAEWWWFTAAAMDVDTARGLLPELQAAGLLTRLPPPRNPLVNWDGKRSKGPMTVVLLTGEVVEGQRPEVTRQPRPPRSMRAHRPRTQIVMELLVEADGTTRQPLLITGAGASPLQVFQTFDWIRRWRFSPAKVEGKPTPVAYQFSINTEVR